jgi:hypothetical protein
MGQSFTTTAKGLLAVWTDVEPDYRTEFQKWHTCEHILERMSIPGFLTGRRYRGAPGAPDFLMCYETEEPAVLSSERYLQAVNRPSPWTRRILSHSSHVVRAIYGLVSSHGQRAPLEAPYLLLSKGEARPGLQTEKVLEEYTAEILPALSRIPGLYRYRLYRVDQTVSHLGTEERKIHGGGPGAQNFLVLFETASPEVANHPMAQELRSRLGAPSLESYWLDFVLHAT